MRNLKLATFSTAVQLLWMGGVLPLLFPEVHDQLCCFVDIGLEVIFLAPYSQGPHLLPVDCLVIVSNQAYYCCVICKLD
jgi:hypothetical protein